MGFVSFDEQSNGVIMGEENFKGFSCGSDQDSSTGSVDSDDDDDNNHGSSIELEVSSSLSSSPCSPFSHLSSSPPAGQLAGGGDGASFNDMSTLLQQLPFKRGLSKHYQGKSQSFTCLSNVTCLEDLAKPENPYNKRLKSCKSYVGLLSASNHNLFPKSESSRLMISKKTSRGSCSSLMNAAKKNTNNNNRPPTHPPYRSSGATSFANQTQTHTPLFV